MAQSVDNSRPPKRSRPSDSGVEPMDGDLKRARTTENDQHLGPQSTTSSASSSTQTIPGNAQDLSQPIQTTSGWSAQFHQTPFSPVGQPHMDTPPVSPRSTPTVANLSEPPFMGETNMQAMFASLSYDFDWPTETFKTLGQRWDEGTGVNVPYAGCSEGTHPAGGHLAPWDSPDLALMPYHHESNVVPCVPSEALLYHTPDQLSPTLGQESHCFCTCFIRGLQYNPASPENTSTLSSLDNDMSSYDYSYNYSPATSTSSFDDLSDFFELDDLALYDEPWEQPPLGKFEFDQ